MSSQGASSRYLRSRGLRCDVGHETCILDILQLPGFLVHEAWRLHGWPLAVQGWNLRRPDQPLNHTIAHGPLPGGVGRTRFTPLMIRRSAESHTMFLHGQSPGSGQSVVNIDRCRSFQLACSLCHRHSFSCSSPCQKNACHEEPGRRVEGDLESLLDICYCLPTPRSILTGGRDVV